jgi:hypothetical protein
LLNLDSSKEDEASQENDGSILIDLNESLDDTGQFQANDETNSLESVNLLSFTLDTPQSINKQVSPVTASVVVDPDSILFDPLGTFEVKTTCDNSTSTTKTADPPLPQSSPAKSTIKFDFQDILPESFLKLKQIPNLNEMKKDEHQQETGKHDNKTDQDKMKITKWTSGKQANIRALLCSLHRVLWDAGDVATTTSRWKPVGMHQLVTTSDVKKMFHKAILIVHPDKLPRDHPEINLARMISFELNNAWDQFQKSP